MTEETKIFIHKKDHDPESAKNLLITMNDPGAYADARPLIQDLLNDQRCRSLILVLSGVAYKYFTRDFIDGKNLGFEPIDIQGSVMEKILELSKENPLHSVIGTTSVLNGPETLMLYGAKSSLRSRRLFYIFCGWSDLGSAFIENKERMDKIDGIFCADNLAKEILSKKIPMFSGKKIFVTGTGQLDMLELEQLTAQTRRIKVQYNLDPDTLVILYLASISKELNEFYGVDLEIEEKTFEKTVSALISAAHYYPTKNISVLFRCHPRDPQKMINEIAKKTNLPPNLTLYLADDLTINEAANASDIICSTCSTEVFKAPARGRIGLFLGFKEPGLGFDLLSNIYDRETLSVIENVDGIKTIRSPEELIEYINNFNRTTLRENHQKAADSSAKILDIVTS